MARDLCIALFLKRKNVITMKLFLDDLEIGKSNLTESIRKVTLELQNHPLYRSVKTLEDVKTYMEYQVWCVWDFMALLKSLQRGLLNNDIEWLPPFDGSIGAFIYEILLTEETDITDVGRGHASHFETYVKAMRQAEANTKPIDIFIENLQSGKKFDKAIEGTEIPSPALEFVQNTLKYAHSELHKAVSVFCLSREGIIPGMFKTFLENFKLENNLSTFLWYLERHIDVDSESHGPLSVKLFSKVVGTEKHKLDAALEAALDALHARLKFLDSILYNIEQNKNK